MFLDAMLYTFGANIKVIISYIYLKHVFSYFADYSKA